MADKGGVWAKGKGGKRVAISSKVLAASGMSKEDVRNDPDAAIKKAEETKAKLKKAGEKVEKIAPKPEPTPKPAPTPTPEPEPQAKPKKTTSKVSNSDVERELNRIGLVDKTNPEEGFQIRDVGDNKLEFRVDWDGESGIYDRDKAFKALKSIKPRNETSNETLARTWDALDATNIPD